MEYNREGIFIFDGQAFLYFFGYITFIRILFKYVGAISMSTLKDIKMVGLVVPYNNLMFTG